MAAKTSKSIPEKFYPALVINKFQQTFCWQDFFLSSKLKVPGFLHPRFYRDVCLLNIHYFCRLKNKSYELNLLYFFLIKCIYKLFKLSKFWCYLKVGRNRKVGDLHCKVLSKHNLLKKYPSLDLSLQF